MSSTEAGAASSPPPGPGYPSKLIWEAVLAISKVEKIAAELKQTAPEAGAALDDLTMRATSEVLYALFKWSS